MPTWNLHVVGTKEVEDLTAVGDAIVKALEDNGHQLVSATLTTDAGPQPVPVSPPAEETEEAAPAEEEAEVPVDTPPEAPVA